MSTVGTSKVRVNPWGLRLGAAGDEDFSLAAREASLDRGRRDRAERAYDQADAAARGAEREKVLKLTEEAVKRASVGQSNILTSGQNQLQRLLFTGGLIASVSIVAVMASSLFGKSSEKKRRRSRSKRKSSFRSPVPEGVFA